MDSIQKELRKTSHYLSMRKREQAAARIDKLEAALNQHSEDAILLTQHSTIAEQAHQIEALTQVILERDLIIAQYLAKVKEQVNLLAFEAKQKLGQI